MKHRADTPEIPARKGPIPGLEHDKVAYMTTLASLVLAHSRRRGEDLPGNSPDEYRFTADAMRVEFSDDDPLDAVYL